MRESKLVSLAMTFGGLAARGAAFFMAVVVASAQAPGGAIAGLVRDPTGAAVPAVHVKATNKASGATRTINTSDQGDYGFASLLAGEYEVSVEASGFRRIVRQAIVEAGTTTSADFTLRVGDLEDSVTVEYATPQIRYDSSTIGGVVTRGQIEGLPL